MCAEEIKFPLGMLSVNYLAVPSNSYSKRMNIQNSLSDKETDKGFYLKIYKRRIAERDKSDL